MATIKLPQNRTLDMQSIDLKLRQLADVAQRDQKLDKQQSDGFFQLLKDGVKDVNQSIQTSEKSSMDLASGKHSNLHETMLAATKAELGFNLFVQMRNKAIEAYQEVMRMQV